MSDLLEAAKRLLDLYRTTDGTWMCRSIVKRDPLLTDLQAAIASHEPREKAREAVIADLRLYVGGGRNWDAVKRSLAALPALVEALEKAERWASAIPHGERGRAVWREDMKTIRAALAQAKGEAAC